MTPEYCRKCRIRWSPVHRSATLQFRGQGRHRLAPGLHGPRSADDPRARLLLRGPRPFEERSQHDDDERRLTRFRGRLMGPPRLLARLRPGLGLVRRALARPALGRRARAAGNDPAPALHGLPGDLRDHHGGPDLRSDRRANAVRPVPRVPDALGPSRLRAGRSLGLGRRVPRPARRARLRGRDGRARQRRRGGPRRGLRARAPQGLRAAGDPAAQRALHAARRRSPVVRLVRLQRRKRPRGRRPRGARLRQHALRSDGDPRRLDAARSGAHGARDGGRCRDGDRRGSRGGDAGGRLRRTARGDPPRRDRCLPELLRSPLARADAARRFARRRRRPRSRRNGRRSAHRSAGAEGLERLGRRPPLRQSAAARACRRSRCWR